MYCLFFVLLLFSTAFSKECDLSKLCEKAPICWPSSEEDMDFFARQFEGFENLKCVEGVLLNKALSFGGGLEKRIQDLARSNSFKNMSYGLIQELYTHKEIPEYLKMIPIVTLRDGFSTKTGYKYIIDLMKHQEYYHIGNSFVIHEFGDFLLDSLEEESKHQGFSWFTNPTWIAFAGIVSFDGMYEKRLLDLFFIIGQEMKKIETRDEIKTAFIITATVALEQFALGGPSFFESSEHGQRMFVLLGEIIQSVGDNELLSVLELVIWCNKAAPELHTRTYENQGFYSIKILWNYLKGIGHKDNAANLIVQGLWPIFKRRYIVWNASKDNDGQEMLAALLNAASKTYGFYGTNDIVDMINGFENGELSVKTKKYYWDFQNHLKLKDFEQMNLSNLLNESFNTGGSVTINLLADQTRKELQESLNSLQDEKMAALLMILSTFPVLSKKIRAWSRSYPVCSALLKRLLSFTPLDRAFILYQHSIAYFLLPCTSFNDLEQFDDGKDSVASAYLLASDLLRDQNQKLEWLFSVRKAIPFLFKSSTEITGAHVELLWTFRVILNEYLKESRSTESKETKKQERNSYILGIALQDFGPFAKIFDRKDLKYMPLKWTLSASAFKKATGILVLDPTAITTTTTTLNNNHKKIPLIKVVELLEKHLDKESKWELIFGYLKAIGLDFIKLKELSSTLADHISKKVDWNKDQKQLASALFACYNLEPAKSLECRNKLASAFRSNAKVLSDLIKFASPSFIAWMPSPYENIEKFHSILVRTNEGSSRLAFKADSPLSLFEDALHMYPEILAQSASSIGYFYNFSDQEFQDFFKGLLDGQSKLFKKTNTNSYIPAWALGKETSKAIGMLLGRYIQNNAPSSAPFFVSLDPTFLLLLLDPSNAKIKMYYKTHYAKDLNDHAAPITHMSKTDLQEGFNELILPEICNLTYTTTSSVSNLFSADPALQMKTTPGWEYLTTEYLELVDCKMEKAFYEMFLEMRKGMLKFLNKRIWNRIHKIKHVEYLLKVEKN